MVGAEFLGFAEFFHAASDGEDVRSSELGDLNGCRSAAARSAEDHDMIVRLHTGLVVQHVPGGDKGKRNRRPFHEGPCFTDRNAVVGAGLGELCKTALRLVAENAITIGATIEA